MRSGNTNCINGNTVTLTCDESSAFNRNLVSLVKQWDRRRKFRILSTSEVDNVATTDTLDGLSLLDEHGVRWLGVEAVPIIFKYLPFGKLAAAMYILPGTMWFTRQLYALSAPTKRPLLSERLH